MLRFVIEKLFIGFEWALVFCGFIIGLIAVFLAIWLILELKDKLEWRWHCYRLEKNQRRINSRKPHLPERWEISPEKIQDS